MPKIYSTSFVNSDSQSVHLTYQKPTCEIPHSLCHDPRQAPYTSNNNYIPRTLSYDLRQEFYTTQLIICEVTHE